MKWFIIGASYFLLVTGFSFFMKIAFEIDSGDWRHLACLGFITVTWVVGAVDGMLTAEDYYS